MSLLSMLLFSDNFPTKMTFGDTVIVVGGTVALFMGIIALLDYFGSKRQQSHK